MIVLQNILPSPMIAVAMAILIFRQNFGGTLFLAFAQTGVINTLRNLVPRYGLG